MTFQAIAVLSFPPPSLPKQVRGGPQPHEAFQCFYQINYYAELTLNYLVKGK